ncbi:Checkpoint protein [Yarrowia sp. B02]|nr:Checkpoint protein [Yarrowia sp. B02]
MKLRAKLDRISLLRDVMSAAVSVRKEAYLIFGPSDVRIVSPAANDGTTISLWAYFTVDFLCDPNQYVCVSSFEDMCVFLLSLDDFARALRSASSYHMDEVRLSLRQYQGLLQLQVRITQHRERGPTVVTHYLPVDPRKLDEESYLLVQPEIRPEVYIMLPKPTLNISKLSERYKRLGKVITLTGNNSGGLKLCLDAVDVNVETDWKGLLNPELDQSEQEEAEGLRSEGTSPPSSQIRFSQNLSERHARSDGSATVTVSCKDWCLLMSMALVCDSVVLAISHQTVLTAYCYTGHPGDTSGFITYYMSHIEE